MVLATEGNATVKENVTNVFGAKLCASLLALDVPVPVAGTPAIFLKGLVSKADHGQGRTSADRQFSFINGRPVELPKVCLLRSSRLSKQFLAS